MREVEHGAMHPNPAIIEEYLAKAKEAEDQAATCIKRSAMQEGWLRIAFAYRDMARANGYKDRPNDA
jgi:hypothetical protein